MPRLRTIGVEALEELATQLRYAPRAAVARHVRAIEELALEAGEDEAYSEDWIVQRITGFAQAIESPALIIGSALKENLSALAERVSATAKLLETDLDGELLGIEDLCARWGVSRKSIERYRRRGLVGVRVRDGEGRVRTVFRREAVEGFEQSERALLDAAREFSRITGAEREAIERAARASDGANRDAALREAARASGRSKATARRTLRELGAAEGITEARGVFDAAARREANKLLEQGAPAGWIAERFGKSAATIRRVSAEVRADRLRGLRLPKWEEDEAALESELVMDGLLIGVENDVVSFAAAHRDETAVDADEERALARGYRSLVARAAGATRALKRYSPSAREVEGAETDLRWAAMVKRRLVRGEMGLVVRTVEERAGTAIERMAASEAESMVRTAIRAVIDAADVFDPAQGGRLAAPAGLLMARALARAGGSQGFVRDGLDWRGDVARWCAFTSIPAALEASLGSFDPDVRRALEQNYGLDGRPPMVVREACRENGVTLKSVRAAVWGTNRSEL